MGAELLAAAAIVLVAAVAGAALSSLRQTAAEDDGPPGDVGGEITAPLRRPAPDDLRTDPGAPAPQTWGSPPGDWSSPAAAAPVAPPGPPATTSSGAPTGAAPPSLIPVRGRRGGLGVAVTDPGHPAPAPAPPPSAAWPPPSPSPAPAIAPTPSAAAAPTPADGSLLSLLGMPQPVSPPAGPPDGAPTFSGLPLLDRSAQPPSAPAAAGHSAAPPTSPVGARSLPGLRPGPAPGVPPTAPPPSGGQPAGPALLPGLGPPSAAIRSSSQPPPVAPPAAAQPWGSTSADAGRRAQPAPAAPVHAGGLLGRAGLGGPAGALAVAVSRLCLAAVFAVAAWLAVGPMVPLGPAEWLPPLVGAVVGAWLPNLLLEQLAARRRRRIERQLPDCLDVVVTCLEGGLGLDLALRRTAQELQTATPELAGELAATVDEWTAGCDRAESLARLRDRTGVEPLVEFLAALQEAGRHGTSIGSSLRGQAEALRRAEAARVEAWARRLPTQVMMAVLVFLVPAVFVLLLGSSLISAARAL